MYQKVGYYSLIEEQGIKISHLTRNNISCNRLNRYYLFLPMLVLVMMLTMPGVVAHTWTNVTVDSTWDVGRYSSLALDSADNPHISYMASYNAEYYYLKYAAKNGGIWTNETVDSSEYWMVGSYSSLALDSAGNPCISYIKSKGLKYAEWTGSAWNIQGPDTVWAAGDDTSLALDSAGHPHISYFDTTNHYLRYAKWNGNGWETQTVDNKGEMGMVTSLVLDSADNPRIFYYDDQNEWLKYAAWNGSGWEIQTVTSMGYPLGLSLALDSAGHPHISYMGVGTPLMYAEWTGSAWAIQPVDSSIGWIDSADQPTSLALDSDGHPHISYYDEKEFDGDLKYAEWTGSAWEIHIVDSEVDVGDSNSLALDSAGKPHISYSKGDSYDLRYAVGSPTPPSTSSITVTSPNGGERFYYNWNYRVEWSYSGDPGQRVKIELLKGGVLDHVLNLSTSIGTGGIGSWNWRVPSTQQIGDNYSIKISSTSNLAINDTSDGMFSIFPFQGVKLLVPNGGEIWHEGGTYPINWNYYSGSNPTHVWLYLLKGDQVVSTLTETAPVGSNHYGSYCWTISQVVPGNDYKIRIFTIEGGDRDDSDAPFTITSSGSTPTIIKIGVTNGQQWYLDMNGNGAWDAGTDSAYNFGAAGWTSVLGDWNGDGKTKIGVYNDGVWYLDNDGSGTWNAGIDKAYSFGATGWTPVVGDWNPAVVGTTIGVYKDGVWYLDWNGNGAWDTGIDKAYSFGATGWTPVIGSWNPAVAGTKIGVTNGQQWYLDSNGNGGWDNGVDYAYSFGAAGWTPVVGDWNPAVAGTTIGVYKDGVWYLDWNGNGAWDTGIDKAYSFGATGWTPVIGSWNPAVAGTKIGVTNGQQWYLDSNGNGGWDNGVDYAYSFGAPGWTPVVGKWI